MGRCGGKGGCGGDEPVIKGGCGSTPGPTTKDTGKPANEASPKSQPDKAKKPKK